MYAIIESGNKQYKVEKGSIIDVELLGTKNKEAVNFEHILLVAKDDDIKIGAPYVKGAKVQGTVIDELMKDDKVTAFKYKNKTGYHRTKGHRQKYTRVQIEKISA